MAKAKKRKMSKAAVKKGHQIAKAIMRKGGGAKEPYAVGSAVAQKLYGK